MPRDAFNLLLGERCHIRKVVSSPPFVFFLSQPNLLLSSYLLLRTSFLHLISYFTFTHFSIIALLLIILALFSLPIIICSPVYSFHPGLQLYFPPNFDAVRSLFTRPISIPSQIHSFTLHLFEASIKRAFLRPDISSPFTRL